MATSADWYCHCCSAKNSTAFALCRVCGREESYVMSGHFLPVHGAGARVYRPSHISTILPNIFEADAFEWQAIHVASYNGNYPLLKSLIENGADRNALTIHGQSPLYLAVFSNFIDCVHILLDAGASPNISTLTEKLTPLHLACKAGDLEMVKLLVKSDADVHAVDNMGRSALHHVAVSGQAAIANVLIQQGISYNDTDVHGWCARQTAEFYGHRKVQEVIVRAGLTVKQSVIKEMPPAEWHGHLWDDFVARNKTMREQEAAHFLVLEGPTQTSPTGTPQQRIL